MTANQNQEQNGQHEKERDGHLPHRLLAQPLGGQGGNRPLLGPDFAVLGCGLGPLLFVHEDGIGLAVGGALC
jgi:hypothetical protein